MIKTIFGVLATIIATVIKVAKPIAVGLATVMKAAPTVAAKLAFKAGASAAVATNISKGVKLAEFVTVSALTNKLIARTPKPVQKPLETMVKYITVSALI